MRSLQVISSMLLLSTGLAVLPPMAAAAGVRTVTTIVDETDGSCADGDCSLRDAVALAASGDTISFAPAMAGQEIRLGNELVIDKELTFNGSELASPLALGGSDYNRILLLNSGADLTIDHLFLRGGAAQYGGAIYTQNGATLLLRHTTISDSQAHNSGVVLNDGGTVIIEDSTLHSNKAGYPNGGYGGALYQHAGTMSVEDSVLFSNSAFGGGGALYQDGGTLNVARTVFQGNTTDDYAGLGSGGGAQIDGGTANFESCVFVDNAARGTDDDGGGALMVYDGDVTFNGCTFARNNTASQGGGIHQMGGSITLQNSVLDGNTAEDAGPNLAGSFSSGGHNLIKDVSGATFSSDTVSNITGVSAALSIEPWGTAVPSFIMAPQQGSPVLDAGDPATCPATDVRGIARRQGSACDIGAYESRGLGEFPLDTTPTVSVTKASYTSDGGQLDEQIEFHDISGDGRFVAFTTESALVPEDTDTEMDAYVRDRDSDADGIFDEPGTMTTSLASVPVDGRAFQFTANEIAISRDGIHVAFTAQKIEGGLGDHLVVRDMRMGTTKLLPQGYWPAFSGDGRYLLYEPHHASTNLREYFLYVYDLQNNVEAPVYSTPRAGVPSASIAPGSLSGNGRYVVYSKSNPSKSFDCGALYPCFTSDVYVYDRDVDDDGIFDELGATGATQVSRAFDGSEIQLLGRQVGVFCGSGAQCISDDGRYILLVSDGDNIVPDDTDGKNDVFVHDRDADADGIFDESGATKNIRVSVSSNGAQVPFGSWLATLSRNGRFVAFLGYPGNYYGENIPEAVFVHDRDADEDGNFDEPGAIETARATLPLTQNDGYFGSAFTLSVSDDGRHVTFDSDTNGVTTDDTNEAYDVFVATIDRHNAGLSGRVWEDDDKDGVQDSGEIGRPQVPVTLYALDGRAVETVLTANNGVYVFAARPGRYTVGVTPPTSYQLSPRHQGADRTADSDFDPVSGGGYARTGLQLANARANLDHLDAGLFTITPNAINLVRFTAGWEQGQLTVRWTTGWEQDVAGFHIWRSIGTRAGAVRVTTAPVRALGQAAVGADYHLVDTMAQPGTSYSYWLEELRTDGTSAEYGPLRLSSLAQAGHVFLPLIGR